LLTPTFNATRGSLLVAALFHFQMNNTAWPDAQLWDIHFFVISTAVIVVLNRRKMFQRGSGVTEVLMPEGQKRTSTSRILPQAAD
jgi:uncharacterized protein